MVDDMSVFSERLIALMKQNGINQKELAQKAGVTESAMSYYVKGDRTPRSDVLTRIAKALETTTDYLLGSFALSSEVPNGELQYLQRNLGKLDAYQLKKAENILKAAFDDIFDDDDEE
jgi:bacteriophage CI repressor helix-turn-helix domain